MEESQGGAWPVFSVGPVARPQLACARAVAPWSSVSVKHPIDIVIETIQLESIERIEYDISDRNLSLQLCNCMTTLRHICSATSHQAKRPTAARRLATETRTETPVNYSRLWFFRTRSTDKSRWHSSMPSTVAVVPHGRRAQERRERLHPHVAHHDQVLLVVQVQLAERRVRSRACQVDAEVVWARAACGGPTQRRTGLGKAL